MSQYLFLLVVLACPLMMVFMMRGHGHGGHGHTGAGSGHAGCGHDDHGAQDGHGYEPSSIDDLRRRRDELDRQIAEREPQAETSGDRSPELV